jgi:hypothetical protein
VPKIHFQRQRQMALLSHIPYHWRHRIIQSERPQMLDNPKKTETLMAALKAAVHSKSN